MSAGMTPRTPAEEQRHRMERIEAKIQVKQNIRGKLYRRKRLEELKLGIETIPLDDAPGLLDYVSAVSGRPAASMTLADDWRSKSSNDPY